MQQCSAQDSFDLYAVQAGLKARHHALMAALEDMDTWLGEGVREAGMECCN